MPVGSGKLDLQRLELSANKLDGNPVTVISFDRVPRRHFLCKSLSINLIVLDYLELESALWKLL
jgi:hypothetical protein